MIPFNKPYLSGNELKYIGEAITAGKISGDGLFTKRCHQFFAQRYGFGQSLLTTSCTDALEMSAILMNLVPGDEVICPSYTFVSTANAFMLRGANLVFVDSCAENPNMDPQKIEAAITPKTKAIVVVHYAGVAVDMDQVNALAKRYGLFVVEDAAQAIESYYRGRPLGTLGDFAAFSFHETKNVMAGEGGLFVSRNLDTFVRAEVIREKGTNRSAFFRGEVDKYGWVDLGSSFLPSDMLAAFLFAQLENLETIQARRISIWEQYSEQLSSLKKLGIGLPHIPEFATNNAHCFYLVCRSLSERTALIAHLKASGILAVFHYLPLHLGKVYLKDHEQICLPHAERYADCLIRLPLFVELTDSQVELISQKVLNFYSVG